MRIILTVIFLIGAISLSAQSKYSQSGIIHTEVQLYTNDGIQINGKSNEMHIEYPENGSKMVITIDPHTILTDNIDFNAEMDNALLGNFQFVSEIDVDNFEFQSRYNESLEIEADATINNIEGDIAIHLVISNQRTNSQNLYIIVGTGEIDVEEYELDEVFPNLRGKLKFQFTQNLRVRYN